MTYFLAILGGGFLGGLIGRTVTHWVSKYVFRRRERQFLRYVLVLFPDSASIETVSVSSSDKKALENIERRLRNAARYR